MEKVQVRSIRNKEQFWALHVDGWRRSGLSQRKYCREKRVALSTFTLWMRRLARAKVVPSPCVELVPLRQLRPVTPVPVVVVLGGGRYRVELAEGFHADTLREVVDVLEVR